MTEMKMKPEHIYVIVRPDGTREECTCKGTKEGLKAITSFRDMLCPKEWRIALVELREVARKSKARGKRK